MKYKEYNITQEQINQINKIVDEKFVYNSKSINYGDYNKARLSNFVGKSAEYFFQLIYPDSIKVDNYDYDFIYQGKKFDIKCKMQVSLPKEHWTFDIPAYQVNNQKNEVYQLFILLNNLTKIYDFGTITKEDFIKKAKFFSKGTLVEENGYRYRIDTYSIKISDLWN